MPAMIEYIAKAEAADKKARLQQQWTDAVERRKITCFCGQLRTLELAYRCLYCGEWFCVPCAEVHFGMTLAEWTEKKRTERRQALRVR